MPFLGIIVNFVSTLVFGILGTLVKKGIPKRISDAVMSAMAICVVYIGIDGAIEAAPSVSENSIISAGLLKVLIMIISMGLGTLLGELLNLDGFIIRLGTLAEKKLKIFDKSSPDAEKGNIARAFVTCSLITCVGAMAVNGAIRDALGDNSVLFAKAVIDSVTCFVLAASLGVGCVFSAFFQLAYQGSIAVIAFFLASFIPADTIAYMSATGSLIIILVGTNVLGFTNVKTANMVPAMFLPIIITPLFKLICG